MRGGDYITLPLDYRLAKTSAERMEWSFGDLPMLLRTMRDVTIVFEVSGHVMFRCGAFTYYSNATAPNEIRIEFFDDREQLLATLTTPAFWYTCGTVTAVQANAVFPGIYGRVSKLKFFWPYKGRTADC